VWDGGEEKGLVYVDYDLLYDQSRERVLRNERNPHHERTILLKLYMFHTNATIT